MSIYKVSERILDCVANESKPFAGIIFDCDGVLIDATKSYDLTVEQCSKAFSAGLGVQLSDDVQLYRVLELLRNLGTFNNDWDSVAVIVAYVFRKSNYVRGIQAMDDSAPLSQRLKALESNYLSNGSLRNMGLDKLIQFLMLCPTGMTREEMIATIIQEKEKRDELFNFLSYPEPVGVGLLSTFFDEAMYGKQVFKETYGLECATSVVSVPGNIQNENVLVEANALSELSRLCAGNLGIITGRPKVPTVHSMGRLFHEFFRRQELCVFTGENLLDKEEVKPSPRPMFKVAAALQDGHSPILYVGDSEEDLLMVERAKDSKLLGDQKVLFAAIAPTRERAHFFENRENVECIVSNVNEVSKALLGERLWADNS